MTAIGQKLPVESLQAVGQEIQSVVCSSSLAGQMGQARSTACQQRSRNLDRCCVKGCSIACFKLAPVWDESSTLGFRSRRNLSVPVPGHRESFDKRSCSRPDRCGKLIPQSAGCQCCAFVGADVGHARQDPTQIASKPPVSKSKPPDIQSTGSSCSGSRPLFAASSLR